MCPGTSRTLGALHTVISVTFSGSYCIIIRDNGNRQWCTSMSYWICNNQIFKDGQNLLEMSFYICFTWLTSAVFHLYVGKLMYVCILAMLRMCGKLRESLKCRRNSGNAVSANNQGCSIRVFSVTWKLSLYWQVVCGTCTHTQCIYIPV